jgi:hypothetical protein
MKNAYSFLAAMCVFLSTSLARSQDADVPQATLNDRAGASEVLPAPERLTLPATNRGPGAPMPAVPTYGAPNPTAAPCLTGPGHGSCLEQVAGWFTYRPRYRNYCGCFPKCAPCCEPPLYTFFLGSCCVNRAAAGCRTAGEESACCGCGHRLAGFWDGTRLRQRLDDFLFYHHEACEQGSCPAGENVVEKPD